jgi:hypothetical protein
MLEKRRGKRSWDGREVLHNQIDIVQAALSDGPPVYPKLCVDCETARQRTLKTMSDDPRHNFRGSARIILVQQGCEHAS